MSKRADKCECGHSKSCHYHTYSRYNEKGKWLKHVESLEECKMCSCQRFALHENDGVENG